MDATKNYIKSKKAYRSVERSVKKALQNGDYDVLTFIAEDEIDRIDKNFIYNNIERKEKIKELEDNLVGFEITNLPSSLQHLSEKLQLLYDDEEKEKNNKNS